MLLKQLRDFARLHSDRNTLEVFEHQFINCRLRIGDKQREQRHAAEQSVVARDDIDCVGHRRQRIMAAQIAKHKFERVSGAHSNGVGVHQATGSILIIGED